MVFVEVQYQHSCYLGMCFSVWRRQHNLFLQEQLQFSLRSHQGKFNVLYENTEQSKEQQIKIDTFFTPL